MTDTMTKPMRYLSTKVSKIGTAASVAGTLLLLLYPLALANIVPGINQVPPGPPETSNPLVVYLSIIGGSVLLVWGAFAVRNQHPTPLTVRRSLLALPVSALGIAAGIAVFVSEWTGTTPVDLEGNEATAFDPSLFEIVRMEVTAVQFVALAAVSAVFVGTVAARRGRRLAAASAVLPITLVVLGFVWGPQTPTVSEFLAVAALAAIPFAIGYRAARPE